MSDPVAPVRPVSGGDLNRSNVMQTINKFRAMSEWMTVAHEREKNPRQHTAHIEAYWSYLFAWLDLFDCEDED